MRERWGGRREGKVGREAERSEHAKKAHRKRCHKEIRVIVQRQQAGTLTRTGRYDVRRTERPRARHVDTKHER